MRFVGCYTPMEYRRIMALYRERHGPRNWPGFRPGTERWHPDSGPIRHAIRAIAAEIIDRDELRARAFLLFQPALRRAPGGLLRALESDADLAKRYRWGWWKLPENGWWQAFAQGDGMTVDQLRELSPRLTHSL
jgi:hypothetical protein